MIAGCAAIVGIFTILAISFAAKRKWKAVASIFPLMIVPIFHLISGPVVDAVMPYLELDRWMIYVIFNTLGLVLSCLMLGLLSLKIEYVSLRILFLSITGIYCVVLFIILISNMILPLMT